MAEDVPVQGIMWLAGAKWFVGQRKAMRMAESANGVRITYTDRSMVLIPWHRIERVYY